jgi:hypothetical protein
MPNRAGPEHEWDLPVCEPAAVHAAERDADLSQSLVWGADPDDAGAAAGPPLMWQAVAILAAVVFWIGLGWAICKWG